MKEQEKIVVMGRSKVQHGQHNDRIFVDDYKHALDPYLINKLDLLIEDHEYGKIIAKTPKAAKIKFIRHGFDQEAKIPGFYNGKKACFFMAKYTDPNRKTVKNKEELLSIVREAKKKKGNKKKLMPLKENYEIKLLDLRDAKKIADIYDQVFKTHPYPVADPSYIEENMGHETLYFGLMDNDELVGVSACSVNFHEENVEVTDFAILPKYRGYNYSMHMMKKMETVMKAAGIKTAYTMTRAGSASMNKIFGKSGYKYGGTLWNNNQISGGIESMNIWYKSFDV
ncbi:putative beta-lysine N-acetyltransferase [Petrocella sp. FN5]|uniref:putative beta-lysine N-acetyltransferase n=1 Tax=Petrocella sp. FN5 TaxID=3032002 RepID=UPI0023DC8685|nr:putative beta-lysine N-acetyltransferase [Petrocella sp. FN5]MDF1617158.1 putative beta-lysine N-acetyltransferase [Petrocella sp. FN5]